MMHYPQQFAALTNEGGLQMSQSFGRFVGGNVGEGELESFALVTLPRQKTADRRFLHFSLCLHACCANEFGWGGGFSFGFVF